MKIIITGCTGFVGGFLLNHLIEDNRVQKIYCIARSDLKINSKKIYTIKKDIRDNSLINLGNCNADVLIHIAGAQYHSSNAKEIYDVNVNGTKNIISFCKKNGVKKIIYISSINVLLKHKGAYAKSKLQAEELVKNSRINYIILRPALIYGPEDNNGAITRISNFINKYHLMPVFGLGNKKEQPVHIYDLNKCILKSVFEINKNYIITVVGADALSYKKLIKNIADASNTKVTMIYLPIWPINFMLKIIEKIGIKVGISYEQLYHQAEDLDINIKEQVDLFKFTPKFFEKEIQTIRKNEMKFQ